MRAKLFSILAVMALVFTLATSASATLTVIGQGKIMAAGGNYGGIGQTVDLVYSSLLDATILNFSNSPNIWWDQQVDWASKLEVNFDGQTLDNWRLPETWEDTINLSGGLGYEGDPNGDGYYSYRYGYNMNLSSEMALLYYDELGNKSYYATDGTSPQSGWGLSNKGPLTALVSGAPDYYWSGTEYSPYPDGAWGFGLFAGYQYSSGKMFNGHALAILPGNAATAPVPGAVWLLGSGLAGLLGLRRKLKS